VSVVGRSQIFNTPTPEDYQGVFIGVSGSASGLNAVIRRANRVLPLGAGAAIAWSPLPTYQINEGGVNAPTENCSSCMSRYSWGYRVGTSLSTARQTSASSSFSISLYVLVSTVVDKVTNFF